MSVKCIVTNQFDNAILNDYLTRKVTYYPDSAGIDLTDNLSDSPFLVAVSDTNNAKLYIAINDTLAYIIQIFYNEVDRMQLAIGYTTGRIASRVNKDGIWTDWISIVTATIPMEFLINESDGLRVIYESLIREFTLQLPDGNNLIYKYKKGMTWKEFAQSEIYDYSDEFMIIENRKEIRYNSDYTIVDLGTVNNVNSNNLIDDQKIYEANKNMFIIPFFYILNADEYNIGNINQYECYAYNYDIGMTWRQFINSSEYNNDGNFTLDDENVKYKNWLVIDDSYNFILPDVPIEAYYPYSFSPSFRIDWDIFTINDQINNTTPKYKYDINMTWSQFIDNGENRGDFSIDNGQVKYNNILLNYLDNNGIDYHAVKQEDLIDNTKSYMSGLPTKYQQVEYLQSSGTQYINSNFYPSGKKLKAEIKFKYTTSHDGLSLFGNATNDQFAITVYGSKPVFYVGTSNAVSCGPQTSLNTTYTLSTTADNGALTAIWNGTKYTASYSGSLRTDRPMFIFGSNNGSIAETGSGYQLEYIKFYDNDVLVRDYIPCVDPDAGGGLYDFVEGKFYGNAGTGSFTVGPEVN